MRDAPNESPVFVQGALHRLHRVPKRIFVVLDGKVADLTSTPDSRSELLVATCKANLSRRGTTA